MLLLKVTAPELVSPIIILPAVMVLISAEVKPKVPDASAPPKLINCPAVKGLRVTLFEPAEIVPVKAILSAIRVSPPATLAVPETVKVLLAPPTVIEPVPRVKNP